MSIFAAELMLFFLIVAVWLGPFLLSLKYKVFNFLHPQTLITINSIIDKRPESEIRINKIKYIKAMEEYAKKTKPKNPRKEP